MVRGMQSASIGAILLLTLETTGSLADDVLVHIHLISPIGVGEEIGTIDLRDEQHGLTISLDLANVPPGKHAFHIHENPDCGAGMENGRMVAGWRAGGHYDPTGEEPKAGHHLPELTAEADGRAVTAIASDRLNPGSVPSPYR